MEDLLRVEGMTPELLFGEDSNRNGLLDPNEDDGEATLPWDNEDGVLNLGLSAYITAFAQETNLRADGTERHNLNHNVLTELFDDLEEELGSDVATYIVAYRRWGPVDGSGAPMTDDELSEAESAIAEALAELIGGAAASADEEDQPTVTRADMDLSEVPEFKIESIYDLPGVQVNVVYGSGDSAEQAVLDSPWELTAADLEILDDSFSHTDETVLYGRIDVNQARFEALMSIPAVDEFGDQLMTEDLAMIISSSSGVGENGEALTDVIAGRTTPGWLLLEGFVDQPTMRLLGPWVTTRGDIYRAQILGYFDDGGPDTRLEVVFDSSQLPTAIIKAREFPSKLGLGYSRALLNITTDE